MAVMKDWVINIITVMIISIFVEMLLPNNSLKKYTQLVVGLIIIIIMIKPITDLSRNKEILSEVDSIANESMNYINRNKIKIQGDILTETQNQQIIKKYCDNLSNQIIKKIDDVSQEYISEVKVDVNEDTNSKEFGLIENVNIVLKQRISEEQINEVDPIQPIDIVIDLDNKDTSKDNKNELAIQLTEKEKKLKEKIINSLNSFYKIPKEKINIKVQKKIKH